MKTILYVTLTADGYVVEADPAHPIPREIMADFLKHVGNAKNLVNGRRTFDLMRERRPPGALAGIDMVIVSRSGYVADSAKVASSPEEALRYLEQKGFDTTLVGGGAQLDWSFLSLGLVDEIYLNIEPVLAGRGLVLTAGIGMRKSLRLLGVERLGDNILQIHYAVDK